MEVVVHPYGYNIATGNTTYPTVTAMPEQWTEQWTLNPSPVVPTPEPTPTIEGPLAWLDRRVDELCEAASL